MPVQTRQRGYAAVAFPAVPGNLSRSGQIAGRIVWIISADNGKIRTRIARKARIRQISATKNKYMWLSPAHASAAIRTRTSSVPVRFGATIVGSNSNYDPLDRQLASHRKSHLY